MNALTITLNALAALGFALAIWQTLLAFRQNKQANEQSKHLAEQAKYLDEQAKHIDVIRASLSTHYLGQFPDFVPQLIDKLKNAKKSIVIVCDFTSYCHFADHPRWIDYRAAIETAAEADKQVAIYCLCNGRRNELMRELLRSVEPEPPDKWKKDADTVKLVDAFLKRTKSKHSAESITTDELLEHDARVNRDAIENVFGRVRPTQLANRAPIYFWIVDELSAVFSIPNFVGPDREQGFATSDPKLISALLKICQRMRKAT